VIYLDTSALVKLVIEEVESPHLEQWLVYQEQPFTTSVIGRIELVRVCRRIDPAAVATANLLLADIPIVPMTSWICDTAENIGPSTLHSLDALHLAAAYELGDTLTSFVAYDKRLRDAAAMANLPVNTPGAC
jgi:predicted nucleic acid-binding protein